MNTNYLLKLKIEKSLEKKFPFNLDLFSDGLEVSFDKPITFFVGDNGSGKSTLLESLAFNVGFNISGGNKNHIYNADNCFDNVNLADKMHLTWRQKTNKGFFFRAENFINFASYIDNLAIESGMDIFNGYGGKSLQKQSHGESFLSLFQSKFHEGLFILDEPESALSAEKQLSLITLLIDLTKTKKCQFIIATHSPLLITIPNSTVYEINSGRLENKAYFETKQFMLYKNYINSPERFLQILCKKNDI